ncbi:MAG: bifunctional 5,10-methylenetetrahydrofolate dehydrogenase/5,10-methenyltetrahydrofolate cyclohydrolase [Nitrospirae bacterium]|nr:bifunctional 5,10-methylenetetrahydrofolate dehydrogenase/5,10-methenyltetrahydrofolate cyclohydrolase [Nitrospirota bacterium]MCL5978834.1 bifunctional 5,10-methylenetetrahydrofolate dehydrogenase/5,10-methenyltetrahydrofolate cyclohydrolase [Nitrospirota bacterium]
MAKIMEGKGLAEEIKNNVKQKVRMLNGMGIEVGLALMLVGDNPSSKQYLSATLRACKSTGIKPYEYRFPESASINELLNAVHSINSDERIHGLLVFFPLPRRINSRKIVNSILPEKDVDGLGSIPIGKFAAEESTLQLYSEQYDPAITHHLGFLPCTPFGVIRLLEYHEVEIKGKHAVVIGKSLAVGKPLSLMLLTKEATVTICHKETKNLAEMTRQADILCVAAGKPNLITGDMVKDGAVVVDIGINMLENGKVTGDIDFDSVSQKASLVTPVPGGVGPVTIAMLLENTVKSAKTKV